MSLDSLKSELERLNFEKNKLTIYKNDISSLGSFINEINTLEVALKIDNYYKVDESSTTKIKDVNSSMKDFSGDLINNQIINNAIDLVETDIKTTKSKIAAEEARLAEIARKEAEAAEAAKAKEEESKNENSSPEPKIINKGVRAEMVK